MVCRLDSLEIAYPVPRSASAFSALIDPSSATLLRNAGPSFYVIEDDLGGFYPGRLESFSELLAGGRWVRVRGFVVPRR